MHENPRFLFNEQKETVLICIVSLFAHTVCVSHTHTNLILLN